MPLPVSFRGRLSRGARALGIALSGMTALAVVSAASPEAYAASPYLEIPDPAEVVQAPAYRYANMTNEEAFAELDRRNIVYSREPNVDGVRAPIRLTGRLHGILIRSALPPEQRTTSVFEILDARLALALDDFAVLLAEHGVDEVIHYTMYRPNVPPPGSRLSPDSDKADATSKAAPAAKAGRPAKRRASLEGKAAKPSKNTKKVATPSRTKSRELEGDTSWKFDDVVAPAPDGGAWFDRDRDAHPIDLHHDHDHDHAIDIAAPHELAAKGTGRRASTKKLGSKSKQRLRTGTLDENAHGKWAPPGTRHPAGLAIDVGGFKMKDGRMLSVTQFAGKIGQQTCGAGAPQPESAEGRELRSIVCEAREREIFTYTLTPNYNKDHQDHFHMEIKPAVMWFLYH